MIPVLRGRIQCASCGVEQPALWQLPQSHRFGRCLANRTRQLARQPEDLILQFKTASRTNRNPRLQCWAENAKQPPAVQVKAKRRIAVFLSGGGSNFRSIHKAILEGKINAEVAVIVTDVPGCGGYEYAKQHGIRCLVYPNSEKRGIKGISTEDLVAAVKDECQVDIVILAGYLKLVPAEFVRHYKRRMLNIHPGLLPAFGGKGYYGARVHAAVISSGARFSGPTVHFVDEEYDTGPILAQRVVPVYPTDTPQLLGARVLKEEHELYPEAVAALVDGRITWRDDGIPILWTAH